MCDVWQQSNFLSFIYGKKINCNAIAFVFSTSLRSFLSPFLTVSHRFSLFLYTSTPNTHTQKMQFFFRCSISLAVFSMPFSTQFLCLLVHSFFLLFSLLSCCCCCYICPMHWTAHLVPISNDDDHDDADDDDNDLAITSRTFRTVHSFLLAYAHTQTWLWAVRVDFLCSPSYNTHTSFSLFFLSNTNIFHTFTS